MEYSNCKICRRWGWKDKHVCPPAWEAILVDCNDEDDPYTTHGEDAEDAVNFLVESKFSDWDYPEEMEILIRKDPDHPWETYDVSVQPVPEFTITKRD